MNFIDKIALTIFVTPMLIGVGALFVMCLEDPMLFAFLGGVSFVLIVIAWAEDRLLIFQKRTKK